MRAREHGVVVRIKARQSIGFEVDPITFANGGSPNAAAVAAAGLRGDVSRGSPRVGVNGSYK